MEKIKKILPYLVVIIVDFYLVPFIIKDTGSAMTVMLLIIPLICFICSIICGIKNAFNLLYIIMVMLLFVPTIFIFYNSSASVYVLIYGIIALIGNGIGSIFYKRDKRL